MLTIASFAVVLVSYSFMTMQPDAATASAAIIIIGSYFWYTYCIRIYNNFKWTDSSVTFTESHHKFVNRIEDQRVLLDMHLSLKEGYFCKKDISTKKKSNPWTRHYFVLQGRYLMYFDSKAQFEDRAVSYYNNLYS
jgi:mannose-6-phosphate isomerase-like protein (cupin superfamily)